MYVVEAKDALDSHRRTLLCGRNLASPIFRLGLSEGRFCILGLAFLIRPLRLS